MPKLLKTSEIASMLGVSSQTIRNTVSKLDLSPTLGKKGVFLFNADQVAAIAESLDKSDRLDPKEDPREQEIKQEIEDQEDPESKQDKNYDDRLFDLIESLQNQIKAKDDQIKAKDDQIRSKDDQLKTKDDQIRSKDDQLKTKDDQIRDLTKAISDLTESNKALAANATMHTLSDKKEALIQDQGQEQEPLEIVPKEKRSFLDKLKELFS